MYDHAWHSYLVTNPYWMIGYAYVQWMYYVIGFYYSILLVNVMTMLVE